MGRSRKARSSAPPSPRSAASGSPPPPADDDPDDQPSSAADLLHDAVDQLIGKASATARARALDSLLELFQHHRVDADDVAGVAETCAHTLQGLLRKGKDQEVLKVLRVAQAFALTLGPDHEALVADIAPHLRGIVASHVRSAAHRDLAARTYALLVFVWAVEPETTEDAIAFLIQEGLSASTGAWRAGALDSIALLLTTVSASTTTRRFLDPVMARLPTLVTDADVDVQLAAGELGTLLCEICSTTHPGLVEAMQSQGGTSSVKQTSKKDRSKQRAGFRVYISSIESASCDLETIKLGAAVLTFASWTERVQLDAVRAAVGPGMNQHLLANSLLHDMFQIDLSAATSQAPALSAREKRLFRSPNAPAAKMRAQRRDRDRSEKNLGRQRDPAYADVEDDF